MNHPFIAIDLETTGVEPDCDQILQIGAVVYGGDGDAQEFSTLVRHRRYQGGPFALQMNAWLLRRLADGEGDTLGGAIGRLIEFIESHTNGKPIAVGFNVGPFDLQFLRRAFRFTGGWPFHHRTVELGSLLSTDGHPVRSSEASKRLGHEVTHDALQDARDARTLHEMYMRGEW